MMKCGLCGYEFNPEEAPSSCKSCSLMKGCKLIRCPNCGCETPPEPRWAKYFKRKEDKNDSK